MGLTILYKGFLTSWLNRDKLSRKFVPFITRVKFLKEFKPTNHSYSKLPLKHEKYTTGIYSVLDWTIQLQNAYLLRQQ